METENKQVVAKVTPPTIQQLIEKSKNELGKALPNQMNPERLVRIALTCIRTTPQLGQCTPASFLGSLFVIAQLGLEPVAGLSYLLPFKNRGVMEVQAVIGYKGYVNLFYRHESALSLDMQSVHEHDDFDYQYGTDSFIKHKPLMKGDRGKPIAYYAVAKMKGGAATFKVMSVDDIMEHGKKHCKSFNSEYSPWVKEFDAMAKKTVLIQLAKLLPLSIEMQRAIQADETSRHYREGVNDAMDLPEVPVFDKAAECEETKSINEKIKAANPVTEQPKTEVKKEGDGMFKDFKV